MELISNETIQCINVLCGHNNELNNDRIGRIAVYSLLETYKWFKIQVSE